MSLAGEARPGEVTPCQCTCHSAHQILVFRYEGEVNENDVLSAMDSVYQSPDWRPGMGELFDLSRVRSVDLPPSVVRTVGDYRRRVFRSKGASEVRVAVYAPHPLAFGFSRMYEGRVVDSPESVRVTRSLDEAYQHLGVAPSSTQ